MPLRIALVGAPQSGKTELAKQLETALERSCLIVDEYIDELGAVTNLAFSHYANYLGNCQVAIARHNAELEATQVKNPDGGLEVLVTCGTILETTVYAALHALANAKTDVPQINLSNDKRAQVTMMWLGIMSNDTWEYNHVFYLPYDGDDSWNAIVDEHIAEAADSLGVKLTELPKVRDERVGKALEEIELASATTTT